MIDLDRRAVEAMMAPVVGRNAVREVARVADGLTNTTYRVTTEDGAAYALRVHAGGRAAVIAEHRILDALSGSIPAPHVLLADTDGAHTYLVYRWIEGVTLHEHRRTAGPDALLALAEPLGWLLARLAAAAPLVHLSGLPLEPMRIGARLARADARLRAGPARERLGPLLADGLRARLAAGAARLEALDCSDGLVHGDFGGRNVLVRPSRDGGWEVSGVIDWEAAGEGSALWDVGSLFRYPHRYPAGFRAAFERGYGAESGELPEDWWEAARLLDSTRLVSILAEPRELPSVFAECRELVEAIVAASGPPGSAA